MSRTKWICGSLAVAFGTVCLLLGSHFVLNGAPTEFASDEEHFKYGSIGAEKNGLPYPIWKALPILCKDKLPNGDATLGLYSEPGHDLPVGISLRKYQVPRIGFNCATCHSTTFNGGTEIILGAPAVKVDLSALVQFMVECITDDRFTPDNVLAAIKQSGIELPWYDRLAYRRFIIGMAQKQMRQSRSSFEWMHGRPAQGPGRSDALGGWKEEFGIDQKSDQTVPTVDIPSIWNQAPREGRPLHWDGDNDSLRERNYSAAMAGGATPDSLDEKSIERVQAWTLKLQKPKFPFPIDATRAAIGAQIYKRERCDQCHDEGGAKLFQVDPIDQLQTDPDRLAGFTDQLLACFNKVGYKDSCSKPGKGKSATKDYPWRFTHYRKTNGYANSLIDGIWARAPYLHNGSVPTLWDLLLPPAKRPTVFFIGCDHYDPMKVGFQCSGPFRFQVSERGNGNGGHLYGTELSDDERGALVEYLKQQ